MIYLVYWIWSGDSASDGSTEEGSDDANSQNVCTV